ncbi:MAG: hypothetical protein ACR2PI_06835 [Hyphomicrobiaceae bacterium]
MVAFAGFISINAVVSPVAVMTRKMSIPVWNASRCIFLMRHIDFRLPVARSARVAQNDIFQKSAAFEFEPLLQYRVDDAGKRDRIATGICGCLFGALQYVQKTLRCFRHAIHPAASAAFHLIRYCPDEWIDFNQSAYEDVAASRCVQQCQREMHNFDVRCTFRLGQIGRLLAALKQCCFRIDVVRHSRSYLLSATRTCRHRPNPPCKLHSMPFARST